MSAGPAPKMNPTHYGYFDFATCVRYAIVHSDEFLRNRIDIQIATSQLKDAHSEILPTLTLVTTYYLVRTSDFANDRSPWRVNVYMSDWNPYLALLKIKSRKIMVDLAKTIHYDKLSLGTSELAKIFYRIHLLEKQIRAQKQLVALMRKKVDYGKSRTAQGSEDPLQERAWSNELRQSEYDLKDLTRKRESLISQLKLIMGYHPDYYLPLDTRNAANQILMGFGGQNISFADIQGNNLTLKTLAKYEQLQSNAITGAYVSLLPQPSLIFEGIGNEVDRTSGVNVSIGFSYTLWDGFRRVRNIKLQKLKYRKAKIDRRKKSRELYNAYRDLIASLELHGYKEAILRERSKLTELSEERAYMNYKSGGIPYSDYIQQRINKIKTSMALTQALSKRVFENIDLATLAGGLSRYHAQLKF